MTLKLRYIALLALSGLIALSSLAVFASDAQSRPTVSVPASHIVMFEDDVDVDDMLAELEAEYGVQARFIYRYALKGASVVVADEFLAAMTAHPGVKLVETNGRVELTSAPLEQEVQDWMRRSGMDVGHPLADIDDDGSMVDVDIAIIDSGVDGSHPDINLYAAIDCVFGRSGDVPPVPDGCTTVFDLSDADSNNDDPIASIDQAGHGTRVASVAAAKDNGFGIVGYAPGARIWSARLSGDDTVYGGLDSSPQPFVDAFLAAVDWVTLNADEIEVANMSLAFAVPSAAAHVAVQNAVNAGIVFFAAAGNVSKDIFGVDGLPGTADDVEPASYPEVATISGYVDTDGLAGGLGPIASDGEADDTFWKHPSGAPWGSNFSATAHAPDPVTSPGAAIDFAMSAKDIMAACVPNAPGDLVQSVIDDCLAHFDGQGGNYGRSSGTSFAAPQAAGLGALLMAKIGTRDINGDTLVNADDVYALRQMLIDLAVAQNNANFGLISGDTDGNPDPIGSAGMLLNFDVTTFSLADTAASQNVTVDTPYLPIGSPETVQLNLIHDSTKFTISNLQCTGPYVGGTPIGPNETGTGTVIGCTLPGGPVADSGAVLTFDVVAANNGTQTFTLDGGTMPEGSGFVDGGALMLNANSPTFDIIFAAVISGSFGLQAVSGPAERTLIAPSATAIPVVGAETQNLIGLYDPATGAFTINVTEPGSYDIQADASGFLSQRYQTVIVDAAGVVTSEPPPTTLLGGDVNGDGVIEGSDASLLLDSFGAEPIDRLNGTGVVDINADGFVSGLDISLLISNLGIGTVGVAEAWPAP